MFAIKHTVDLGVRSVARVIEAKHLYRFYHSTNDETFALRGVSLDVAAGELVAVVGPSGCGKSTLLNCLAGTDTPDGGMVRIEGEPFTRLSKLERDRFRGRHIGVLLQSANLFEHLSVLENVRFAQVLGGRGTKRKPEDVLTRVGLGERRHAIPSTLSGGESSRAGLAVALANSPSVLLADEPTGELDSDSENALIELLLEQVASGVAAVVVTHSPTMAAAATRVLYLEDGQFVHG